MFVSVIESGLSKLIVRTINAELTAEKRPALPAGASDKIWAAIMSTHEDQQIIKSAVKSFHHVRIVGVRYLVVKLPEESTVAERISRRVVPIPNDATSEPRSAAMAVTATAPISCMSSARHLG